MTNKVQIYLKSATEGPECKLVVPISLLIAFYRLSFIPYAFDYEMQLNIFKSQIQTV